MFRETPNQAYLTKNENKMKDEYELRSKSKTRTRVEFEGRVPKWAVQNDEIVELQNSTQEFAQIPHRSHTS